MNDTVASWNQPHQTGMEKLVLYCNGDVFPSSFWEWFFTVFKLIGIWIILYIVLAWAATACASGAIDRCRPGDVNPPSWKSIAIGMKYAFWILLFFFIASFFV